MAGRMRRPAYRRHSRRTVCDDLYAMEPPHSASGNSHFPQSERLDKARSRFCQSVWRQVLQFRMQVRLHSDRSCQWETGDQENRRKILHVLGRGTCVCRHFRRFSQLDSIRKYGRLAEKTVFTPWRTLRQPADGMRSSSYLYSKGNRTSV